MPKHPETHITVSVTREVHERLKEATRVSGARSQSQAIDWMVSYCVENPEALRAFKSWRADQYLQGK